MAKQRRVEVFDVERDKLAEEVNRRTDGREILAVSHSGVPGFAGFVTVLLITEKVLVPDA